MTTPENGQRPLSPQEQEDLSDEAEFVKSLWEGVENGTINPEYAHLHTSVINDRAKRLGQGGFLSKLLNRGE